MKNHFFFFFVILLYIFISGCNTADPQNTKPTTDTLSRSDSTPDWALLGFKKADSSNPILETGTGMFRDPILNKNVLWEEKDVFNPAVVVKDGKVFMLYRAEDKIGKYAGTSRIGLAESTDGIHFTKHATPVLYPDNDAQKKYEWEGGCEDPRVVEDDKGTYYMTYTAYDGDKARLLIASSDDLLTWKKHGHVFAKAYSGKYVNTYSKSGAIVSEYNDDGRIIARKINGKYWMYWGDKFLWVATSDDLINWTPVEKTEGEKDPVTLKDGALLTPDLKIVLGTRDGKFDSDLVESGPPAMITDNGILVIYNSRNIPAIGDKDLVEGTYTASQVLMDKNNPVKILKRLDEYFIRPDRPYETEGQVNQVCFLEGLAKYKNNWFLYYGTADSKIAVAIRPVHNN